MPITGSHIAGIGGGKKGGGTGTSDHAQLSHLDAAHAGHTGYVETAGNQTVAGTKTFSNEPIITPLAGSGDRTLGVDASGKMKVVPGGGGVVNSYFPGGWS